MSKFVLPGRPYIKYTNMIKNLIYGLDFSNHLGEHTGMPALQISQHYPLWVFFSSQIALWWNKSLLYKIMYIYHFDTLEQRNTRTYISHTALLASLNNMVIGNGDLCTTLWSVIFAHPPFLIIEQGQRNQSSYTDFGQTSFGKFSLNNFLCNCIIMKPFKCQNH